MAEPDQAEKVKKPSLFAKIKQLWLKLEIPPIFILLAIKGAIPATIALAGYEALDWAHTYTTLGYLVAVMSQLGLAIQPRAKFIQSMFMNVAFTCLGAALALLEMVCVVAARSAPPAPPKVGTSGTPETPTYDAAACTTAAVWLTFYVFCSNCMRAARPQLMLPTIQLSIFIIVASVYAPDYPTMHGAMLFVRKLLYTFLTGQAIATGVSLLILPMTSRSTVEKQMGGLTKLLKGCVATHGAYMRSISKSTDGKASEEETQAAAKVREMIIKSGELFGKLKLELGFARKEIAWGKLSPHHYSDLWELYRQINQPMLGMSTFIEILKSLRQERSTYDDLPEAKIALDAIRKLETEEWDEVVVLAQDAQAQYQKAMFLGFDHIGLQLEFEKRPKKSQADQKGDVESAAGATPKPGDAGFSQYLEEEIKRYLDERNRVVMEWAQKKDLSLSGHFEPHDTFSTMLEKNETSARREKLNQHQLYLILYMNFLSASVGKAILNLAKYADGLVEDGTMKKKRIINPGLRRLRKLFQDAFTKNGTDETLAADANGGTNIYLGDALQKRKNPEHLPPANTYERVTDQLRQVSTWLSSDVASFGLRAAAATMTLGVVAYLRDTRTFFLNQRGMWALIMTAISMDPHAGQGLFGFVGRILGTIVATVSAIAIWYMCDHNHAGILVVFAIYMSFWMLFLLKNMQYAIIAMISSVTVILIIGYELQVDVIGLQVAESNGQEAYPVYILAPYRLATVCIGLGSAFIWTYFPYPITTHGALRRDLGSTLYILANFYSTIHTTLEARLQLGAAVNDLPANHPVKKLDSARAKVFGKILLMLTRLREHSRFQKYEPRVGGRFPIETYEQLITSTRNLFTYFALILYSSRAFIREPQSQTEEEYAEEVEWLNGFREFAADTEITSHEITTNLCLLSASIRGGAPLPPYLRSPRTFAIGDKMQEVDPALVNAKHFSHPCYAAFAVGEVASAFVTAELAKITKLVKELVGEVDFSFHIISTNDDGSSTTSTLWERDAHERVPNGSDEKKKGD